MSASTGTASHGDPARWGALSAVGSYLLWGLVPLYWKRLAAVDAIELIAHRHLWSLLLLALMLVPLREAQREAMDALRSWASIRRLVLGGVLLTTNWLVYVWGVNTGHIIETSLGYFLVPLFSVVAGRFVLGEHLRRVQWAAVGVAAVGVAGMVMLVGNLPWIALLLAGSWGSYSVLRKKARIGPIPGLAVETLIIAPVALGYLVWRHRLGLGAMGSLDLPGHLLLLSSGLVTAVPLLLFAHAAPRIRLSTLGLLQYIAPSLQLGIGVAIYHESLKPARLACFALIWLALGLYSTDAWLAQRRSPAA